MSAIRRPSQLREPFVTGFIFRLLLLIFLVLPAACSKFATYGQSNSRGVNSLSACDVVISNVCVMRPGPDYMISIIEISRGFEGKALDLKFISNNSRIEMIVNQFISANPIRRPGCMRSGNSYCASVLYSKDWINWHVVSRRGGRDYGYYRGAHVDVISATKGLDVQALTNNAIRNCSRAAANGPITCTGDR